MGFLTDRFGSRTVSTTGAAVALLGTLPFALFGGHHLSTVMLCTALFVRGVGLGSISIPSMASAYAVIAKPMIPVATTSLNIAQRLGGPMATTLLAIFLHSRMQHQGAAGISAAFTATFWLLCAIHFGGMIAALRLPATAENTSIMLAEPTNAPEEQRGFLSN